MNNHCMDHTDCDRRIGRLEKEQETQWEKLDSMAAKLNLILGGIVISPFIVALLTFLLKAK